jgi:biotin carboxyl carrier protein
MKEFKFKINGKDYEAQVAEQDNGVLAVTLNGSTYAVEVPALAHHAAKPVVHAAAPAAAAPAAASKPAAAPAAAGSVTAPLPGTIKQVLVSDGQKVKKGDTIITMEAMKMENAITAEADGIVVKVRTSVGASVNQGDVLVDFAAEAAAAPAAAASAPKPAAPASAPKAAPAPAAAPAAAAKNVEAPLPGTIKQVLVAVGQEVAAGDTVVIMEAMKMENNITAEFAGKVTAVNVAVGDQVQSGQALVVLA